jgi:hypothetical protein
VRVWIATLENKFMGTIARSFVTIILLSAVSPTYSFAAWRGPETVLTGGWGSEPGHFGIDVMETSTILPSLQAVLPDGKIVIADSVNNKQIVINPNGTIFKEIKWILQRDHTGKEIYVIPEYAFGNIVVYKKDGTFITTSAGKYYLYSGAGQLLEAYTNKPLEAGEVKKTRQSDRSYKITVSYPDKGYSIIVPRQIPDQITKDVVGNLYITQRLVDIVERGTPDRETIQHYRVIHYNSNGQDTGRLNLPNNTYEIVGKDNVVGLKTRVLSAYGQPVISTNGDVYTWKQTPDKYSIIKWTWVDDPDISKKSHSGEEHKR